MKQIIILILFILLKINVFAQSTTAYVVYKSYNKKENFFEFYHWFTPNMQLHTEKDVSPLPEEYPVNIDGKWVMSKDSNLNIEMYRAYREAIRKSTHLAKQPLRYRNYNSNIKYRSSYIGTDTTHYIVVDTLSPMSEWRILDEKTKILGFTCQKAITNFKGTNFIAYFTTELPYPAGPNNFRGLPGLILKVQSESGLTGYFATEIIHPYKGVLPVLNSYGKLITQKQAEVLIEEANRKAMGGMFKLN